MFTNLCSDRAMLCIYSDIACGVCVLYLWATDSGPVLPGNHVWSLWVTPARLVAVSCGDRGIIQYDMYSGEEKTCLLCNIKLCIHPMKQSNSPAIVLYEMLLL